MAITFNRLASVRRLPSGKIYAKIVLSNDGLLFSVFIKFNDTPTLAQAQAAIVQYVIQRTRQEALDAAKGTKIIPILPNLAVT